MAKKRKAPEQRRRETPRPGRDIGAVVAVAALAAVLAGTALLVDTRAEAAFDAPKRLVALAGTAVAAAAAFALDRQTRRTRPRLRWHEDPMRMARTLALAALGVALVSALASPRRTVSLEAMRTVVLLAFLLPLGASDAVAKGKGRGILAAVFLGAAAVNAAVSMLQSGGRFRPFLLETLGARQDTGAYAGNVGYLAITLALAGVLSLGAVLTGRVPLVRGLSGIAFLLFVAALAVNRNLTALTALVAGAAVLLVFLFRRRALLPVAAVLVAAGLSVVAYAPLRQRAREVSSAIRTGNWDAVVSYRGGPWAAAVEMTRERPLLGFGPGTFSAEYVSHRLAAEIRARRRFVNPLLTSSYGEAHSDYLQVFSDAGVPAGMLALGAVSCLFVGVGRAAWRTRERETVVLLAVLAASAAAALTWFPLQRPITAVPVLLAAGRAWRISGGAASPEPES